MRTPNVSMVDLVQAQNSDMGWCTSCQDFTTGCCEPDAQEHTCESCGESTVYGAEEAALMGLFTVDGEEAI